jgi:nucleotide-binding universal stress UspA family protein
MIPRILVPLDGSPGSSAILGKLAHLPHAERAIVRLLHVAPDPEPVYAADGTVVAYADQVAAGITSEWREYLAGVATTVPGVHVETVVRFGDPAAEILDEARSSAADVIAMATHRRRGLRRIMKGSVAEAVERRSPVPVLLVGHGEGSSGPRGTADSGPAHTVRRRFWCATRERDVEVHFLKRRLPGPSWTTTVRSCSVFDPSTAVACRRPCVDAAYRRGWPSALPVRGAGPAADPRI